jgi:flagellar hook-basal body complex protein FliE
MINPAIRPPIAPKVIPFCAELLEAVSSFVPRSVEFMGERRHLEIIKNVDDTQQKRPNSVSPSIQVLTRITSENYEKPISHDPISDFKTALSQSIDEVNQLLAQADQSTQEMLLGKQDIHQAMIAMEQANISLRLMIQIRNKIIAAYEQIMQMQF